MLRVSVLVLLLATLVAAAQGLSPLPELDEQLSLLEQQADPSLSVSSSSASLPPTNVERILAEARKYANDKIEAAVKEGKSLLQHTVEDALQGAEAVNDALKATTGKAAALSKAAAAAAHNKSLVKPLSKKPTQSSSARVGGHSKSKGSSSTSSSSSSKSAAKSVSKSSSSAKSASKGGKLKPNRQGLYGAVVLGAPKSASGPATASSVSSKKKKKRRGGQPKYHLGERISKHHPRTCLKDIAAHYDEEDIYEQRKLQLQQEIEGAEDRTYARELKAQLAALEQYHQTMQRKFMLTAKEAKQFLDPKNMGKYRFSKELIAKIKANRAAKKAGLPLPFPQARKLAMKEIRKQKVAARRLAAQMRKSHGNKRMVLPVIDDPWFPSRDHISSTIRERMWRRVETDPDLSTNKDDLEVARKIVKDENKRHDDFIHSDTAKPFRKRIHNAITPEPLKPAFLVNFPWPTRYDGKIHLDSKVQVPQMDFQEW